MTRYEKLSEGVAILTRVMWLMVRENRGPMAAIWARKASELETIRLNLTLDEAREIILP